MKKYVIYYLIGLFVIALACTSSEKKPISSSDEVVIDSLALKTAKLHVSGMTCGGCENKVTQTIQNFAGVIVTEVSHSDSLAVFQFDTTRVKITDVIESIENLHYTVDGYEVVSDL